VFAFELHVTDGRLFTNRDAFVVTVPEMRASGNANGIAQLIVINPTRTAQTSHLRNGDIVSQIGLKINEQNVCNLVYVMRVFEPKPHIVVSVKSNPGAEVFSDCLDHGYTGLASFDLPDGYESFSLQVAVYGDVLTLVYLGSVTVIQDVHIPQSMIGHGFVGVRSDNVQSVFKLSVDPQ
jgi:hypothetical protein